jgi:hypothetical protein
MPSGVELMTQRFVHSGCGAASLDLIGVRMGTSTFAVRSPQHSHQRPTVASADFRSIA